MDGPTQQQIAEFEALTEHYRTREPTERELRIKDIERGARHATERNRCRTSSDSFERMWCSLAEQGYGMTYLERCGCHPILAKLLVLGE